MPLCVAPIQSLIPCLPVRKKDKDIRKVLNHASEMAGSTREEPDSSALESLAHTHRSEEDAEGKVLGTSHPIDSMLPRHNADYYGALTRSYS